MPREIIHWIVLERAADRAKAAGCPAIAEAISSHRDAACLGALLHDVPYYFRMGKDPFEQVADWLHGKHSEDTLLPMRKLASAILSIPPAERRLLWPFFLGMLGHIGADVVFHPLVFYFTGNYHDRDPIERRAAQGRHRLFEVYLDAWGRKRFPSGRSLRINSLIKRVRSAGLPRYCALLESLFVPEIVFNTDPLLVHTGQAQNRWFRGVHTLGTFQQLFLSPVTGALVRSLNWISRGALFSEAALFSFGRFGYESFFEAPLRFKAPMGGEEYVCTGDELLEAAIEETLELFRLFEPFVSGQHVDVEQRIGGVYGKSLNMGVPHAISEDASYFAAAGAPLPGLVRTEKR